MTGVTIYLSKKAEKIFQRYVDSSGLSKSRTAEEIILAYDTIFEIFNNDKVCDVLKKVPEGMVLFAYLRLLTKRVSKVDRELDKITSAMED